MDYNHLEDFETVVSLATPPRLNSKERYLGSRFFFFSKLLCDFILRHLKKQVSFLIGPGVSKETNSFVVLFC